MVRGKRSPISSPTTQAQYHPLAVDETAQPGHTYFYRLIARNEAGVSRQSKLVGPVVIRCRTLVDELRNLSLTYRKGGKLELKYNDARNFKEDCHRLCGEPVRWIAYKVPGRITAMRVYAFGEKDDPELEFRSGQDMRQGEKLAAQPQDFYAGKEMYNFRWPRIYTLNEFPDDGSSVTIGFQKEAQIGRVEIEYQ